MCAGSCKPGATSALENGCGGPLSHHRDKGRIFLASHKQDENTGMKYDFDFTLFNDPFEFHKLILGATPDNKEAKTPAEKKIQQIKMAFGSCRDEQKCIDSLMEFCGDTAERTVQQCSSCEACMRCKTEGGSLCTGTVRGAREIGCAQVVGCKHVGG